VPSSGINYKQLKKTIMNKRKKTIATITLSVTILFASLFAVFCNKSGIKNVFNSSVEALSANDGPSIIVYIEKSDPGTFTCKCDNYNTYLLLRDILCICPLNAVWCASLDYWGIDPFEVQYQCCTAGSGRCNKYDPSISPELCKKFQTGYWNVY